MIKPKRLLAAAAVALVILVLVVGHRAIWIKKMHIWFGDYLSTVMFATPEKPAPGSTRHLLVMFADHFEPSGHMEATRHWMEQFRRCRSTHLDADGRHPQHTFFYPAEQFREEEMVLMVDACRAGYGEVEVQLHHAGDTPETLTAELRKAIDDFSRYGCLVTATDPPDTVFGFVHGNWALDNSRTLNGADLCGVDNEITILRELGCYADFTFPAIETTAQPAIINRFYYAADYPAKPKSHNRGTPMAVGGQPSGDLLIMHGILTIDWLDWSHIFYPSIESGNITYETLPSSHRADVWVSTNVHVAGRPEWTFVKLYGHGAVPADTLAMWGPETDALFDYFESRYNDGTNWVLHYVTAREMYNIARAAEAGHSGNPVQYRDYLIKPYLANIMPPPDALPGDPPIGAR